MTKSISLTLLLGHDLSNAALIIFARVSQAMSISDGHSASVIIRLLIIYFFKSGPICFFVLEYFFLILSDYF